MSLLPRAMCQSITRVRATSAGKDAYNNKIPGTPATLVIDNVSLQPLMGATTETNGVDFDRIVTRWKLFTPPGVDLVTTDRIQQGSLDLEVDGEPVTWPGVDGQPHHIECMLKRYGG